MNFKSIAFITPHRLGDAIFTTPFIRFLRKKCPTCEITILATSGLAYEVYQGNPNCTALHDATSEKKLKLPTKRFDLIIGETGNKRAIMIANQLNGPCVFTAGARISLKGQPKISIRTGTNRLEGKGIHVAQEHIRAFQKLFQLEETSENLSFDLTVEPTDRNSISRILSSQGLEASCPLIGLHIGCRNIQKKIIFVNRDTEDLRSWRLKEATRFCDLVAEQYPNFKCVLSGTGGEAYFNKRLAKSCSNVVDLSNRLTIKESAALADIVRVYICTDTGMQHVISSTSAPLIGLFGSTNPTITGPYPGRKEATLIEAPNMEAITASQVLAAAEPILKSYA